MTTGFSIDSVTTLDFNFTGIPREDGKGNLTERGIVAEPSEARLDAFTVSFAALNTRISAPKDDDAEQVNIYRDMRAAIIDLCGGSPSPDELGQMPPRYLAAFFRWLMSELQGPKE